MKLIKIIKPLFIIVMFMVSGCAGIEPLQTTATELNQPPDTWEMITDCHNQQERNELFEKLWENNSNFRNLVQQETHGEINRELIAGVYCLLMADPEISWRRNAGEKLFYNFLKDFQPEKLRNPDRIALYTSIRAECGEFRKKPVAQFPVPAPRHNNQAPEKTSSVTAVTTTTTAKQPATELTNFKLKQPTEQKNTLTFKITVIRASNHGTGYAVGLETMAESLKPLQFTHYDLVRKETLNLKINEIGEVILPGLNRLNLKLLEFGAEIIITEININGDGQVLMSTKVEAPYGGNILIASPQPGRDRILVRIDFTGKKLHI